MKITPHEILTLIELEIGDRDDEFANKIYRIVHPFVSNICEHKDWKEETEKRILYFKEQALWPNFRPKTKKRT